MTEVKLRQEPDLRISGFNEAWEQHKVSDITKFHKQGFYTTEDYNENKKYYLLRGTDLTENKLVLKDTPKIDATEKDYAAFKTEIGDFLIVRSGTVGTYGIVDVDIPAIFGSYLIDFRFDMEQVTNEFFGYFYQSNLFKTQLNKIIQASANTNINAENIKSATISLPSLDEQKRISAYLGNLDNLITLHQHKFDKLKKVKEAMLIKMFPQNGSNMPEIRFKGFDQSWLKLPLSKIVTPYVDPVPTPTEDYYRLGIRSHAKGTFHNYVKKGEALETAQMHRVASNRLIVNITFAWEHAVAITDENDAGKLVSHRFPQFSFNEGMVSGFFKYIIINKKFKHHLGLSSPGGAGRNKVLKIDEMLKYEVYVPRDSNEQKKIRDYFENLDLLIFLQQSKVEKLTNMKKALLSKMFV